MKTDAILKADVLDIIFENKNKSYGAYSLRKFYNNRLYKALGLMGCLVILLCSFTFLSKTEHSFITREMPPDIDLAAPPKDPIKPEKPKTEKAQPIAATVAIKKPSQDFSIPLITDKKTTKKIENLIEGTLIDNEDRKGNGETPKVAIPNLPKGVDSSTIVGEAKVIDRNKVVEFAEVMPAYPGGMDALRKYLEKNLQNPEEIEEGQTISVKVRFVVGYDGALKNLEIVEDGGSAFNNEVLRVVKKMKAWIPGKTKGENVSVYYTIPIKFTTTN
jgi:periplasmic protein TonB